MLYLTPVFPARSNHRYDASTFDHVDPVLGGDEAFAALVEAAHARGLRVMGDLTTNHTGDAHEWFLAARADAASPEAGFYSFDEHPERYASWLGVTSLPKLDQSSAELRARLYDGPGSVVARWLEAGLDAWRIDVANMTGRAGAQDLAHDVARTLVATARAVRPDAWVLAEHGHDAGGDLQGDGWHGTMDYAGFTRPVWTWLHEGDALGRSFFGQPATTPVLPASAVVATMREVHAAMPWRSQAASSLHLDSHDVPRFRTVVGGGGSGGVSAAGRDRHLAGLALQMALPGVPTVFAGDEIGLTGVDGEHARTPFPWHRRDEWDEPTLQAYRAWTALRRDHVALRRGGLRWVHAGDDAMTFLREHADERVLVHVARAPHDQLALPLRALGVGRRTACACCWVPQPAWSTASCSCPATARPRRRTSWAEAGASLQQRCHGDLEPGEVADQRPRRAAGGADGRGDRPRAEDLGDLAVEPQLDRAGDAAARPRPPAARAGPSRRPARAPAAAARAPPAPRPGAPRRPAPRAPGGAARRSRPVRPSGGGGASGTRRRRPRARRRRRRPAAPSRRAAARPARRRRPAGRRSRGRGRAARPRGR